MFSKSVTAIRVLALAACLLAPAAHAGAAEPGVVLYTDQARVMKLEEGASTVIIGNPVYADAVLRPSNVMVITGKTPGSTNLIVLDGEGNILSERMIHVTTDKSDMVVMHKGTQRFTYSCTIRCENAPQVGDSTEYMDATINQTRSRLELSNTEASR